MIQSLLNNAGIACVFKNQYASSLAGEVPFQELWPEIWVVDEYDVIQAIRIIQENAQVSEGDDWECSECGEVNAASFELCWQCGYKK